MSVTLTDAQFAALLAKLASPLPTVSPLTLGEACTRYIATKQACAPATHKLYRVTLRHAATALGWTRPLSEITALDLATYLSTLPTGQAHNVAIRLRAFYRWCAHLGLVAAPMLPQAPHKAKGHTPWSEADLTAYRLHWPWGTRQRLIMEAALATGLRRSDLAAALWQPPSVSARGRLDTAKTGETVWLTSLDALRAKYPSRLGRRLSGHSLGLKFTLWSRAAGLSGRSLHGLRKTFLERAAEAGCTGPELMVLAGHKTLAMTSHYIRRVDRAKLAASAQAKLKGG